MKAVDQQNNKIVENLGYTNLPVQEGAAQRGTNAQSLDTWLRSVAALTTNTYDDTDVVYEYSLNAIIDEEG